MSYFKQHGQKRNWDKETASSNLGILLTNWFFASSCIQLLTAFLGLSFFSLTLFVHECGFNDHVASLELANELGGFDH